MTEKRRQARAQRKAVEAATSLLLLGTFLLLAPLLLGGANFFGRAVAPLWPVGLLFVGVGSAMLWVNIRVAQRARGTVATSSSGASSRAREASLPDDLAAVREHARDRDVRAGGDQSVVPRPATWSTQVFDLIEWRRFEAVVETLFRQAGFITKSEAHGADGGVDVWLYSKHQPDGKPVSVVQCKHWSGKRVGVDKVRELRGVMAAHGVQRGQFATTSEFTPDAVEFAASNGINLLDIAGLLSLIGKRSAGQQQELLAVALEGDYRRPTCVNCGAKMVERTPKSGGRAFWGCPAFPKCRTTLPMRTSASSL